MRTLGQNIRDRRKAIGMTQMELAKRCGLYDASSISKIEHDANDISSSTLMKIAKALGTTAGALFDGIHEDVYSITPEEKDLLVENAKNGEAKERKLMSELFQLSELFQKGLLTEEEYAKGKKFIMEMMK